MNKSILNKFKKEDFFELLDLCSEYIDIDREKAYESALEVINEHSNKKDFTISEDNYIKTLEKKWYDSIRKNDCPDYSVYSDPRYICDVWVCWSHYSRNSLKALIAPKSLITKSVVDHIGKIKTVVDVGCGFAYTTAGLKEIFPEARVIGTNLEESYQFKVAKDLGRKHGFEIVPDTNNLKDIDLVFASEYFEHIINPIEHAYEIIRQYRPKFIITANGFNGTAIGHFDFYDHMGKVFDNKTMSRNFNKAMRMMGYKKLETKIWNNRPMVWERIK